MGLVEGDDALKKPPDNGLSGGLLNESPGETTVQRAAGDEERRIALRRRRVLNVSFDFIGYDDTLATIHGWRLTGQRRYIAFTPPYSVMLSMCDVRLADATSRAGLVLPDGIGIIAAAKILGYAHSGRVSGPTLMLRACDWGRRYGYRHYFCGGAPGVAEELARRLCLAYPGLEIVGTYCPPFTGLSEEEDQRTVERINAAKPDIVWVGLGSPKQELWMRDHVGRVDASSLIGVGAAFDFHSGRVKWAPAFMRRLGLEWAYRLVHEPRRLWRRTVESPRFLLHVVRQRFSRRGSVVSGQGLSIEEKAIPDRPSLAQKAASTPNGFSVDVEEWFHILNTVRAPTQREWTSLEMRVERNMDKLLQLLDDHGAQATFFWLGWVAERHKTLLRKCSDIGHEIASHGHNHVQPLRVGPASFRDDIERAKNTIEDIIGRQINGFRTAGFGTNGAATWIFDTIREAGYRYDSSVFTARSGGLYTRGLPYVIRTKSGPLIEVPIPAIQFFGLRLFLFGGGYLRLSPQWLIRWGVKRLRASGSPLILYVHPREVDREHSGMRLGLLRRYRHFGNVATTMPKLNWLLENDKFVTLGELAWGVSDGQL